MNILLVTDTYEPQINGLVTALKIYKSALEKKKINVYLLVPKANFPQEKNVISIFSLPFPFLSGYKIVLPPSMKKIKYMKNLEIDLIHTHSPFFLGIYVIVIAKKFSIPVVHTYHTYFEEYLHYVKLPVFIGRLLIKYFSLWYCKYMNEIIVPSKFMKNVLVKYGLKKKIEIIPTGYYLDYFKNSVNIDWREKLQIPKKSKILLYVGRLAKEKNLYFLIDLLKELIIKYPNLYLIFTGDGPEKKHLIKYSLNNKVNNNIKFTGFIEQKELKAIYQTGDIFVFPSLTETQGLVILEAILNKLPIIAFYERGVKSIMPEKNVPA